MFSDVDAANGDPIMEPAPALGKPMVTVASAPDLLSLPSKVRAMILAHAVASPNIANCPVDALVGPTIAQKGTVTRKGRDWTKAHLKPYLAVRSVCRVLRADAALAVGQANVFKIKYPVLAIQWFKQLNGSLRLSAIRRLDITLATVSNAWKRAPAKYPGVKNHEMTYYWVYFVRSLVGVALEELRITFTEWGEGKKTGFHVPFWTALGQLSVSKRLVFAQSFPREGFTFLDGLWERHPELEFDGTEAYPEDWE